MKQKSLHPRSRGASVGFALSGIISLIRQEPNAKIHAVATVLVLILGWLRHITSSQWLALVIVIVLVWMAEAFNTAVEGLCDLLSEGEYHAGIKIIKDISAAAVLISALGSVITGLIIFIF